MKCLFALFKESTKSLTCPSCLFSHKNFNSVEDLNGLIKNYALISLVETSKPYNQKVDKKGKQPRHSATHIDDMEETKSEDNSSSSDNGSPQKKPKIKIKHGQTCEKHGLIVHSFVKSTHDLLCTKCIYEKNLSGNQI
jgi:hypothetical protein